MALRVRWAENFPANINIREEETQGGYEEGLHFGLERIIVKFVQFASIFNKTLMSRAWEVDTNESICISGKIPN